jgi:flavin-dependent dehydrogenase
MYDILIIGADPTGSSAAKELTANDCWLAQKAVSAGAELREETVVTHCDEQTDCVIAKLKSKDKGEYFEKSKNGYRL